LQDIHPYTVKHNEMLETCC